MRISGLAFGACLALAGCSFIDARRQQQQIDAYCVIGGEASAERADPRPIVVVLARRAPAPALSWQIVDHFVLERPGRWEFFAPAGSQYAVAAFEDANRDFAHQPGEGYASLAFDHPLECGPGARHAGLSLHVPARSAKPFPYALDIAALHVRSADEQLGLTLGQYTAVGEVAALSDPRFAEANARDSLWRPLDFVVAQHPGIYFLEPYDPARVPVLFVHGLYGTPRNFAYLIEHLDRTRFQPWVYYYPSGAHLDAVAGHLNQTVAKLQQRYHFARFALVGYSMGGLVSREFLLQHGTSARAERLPILVTLSTPWGGDPAAQAGVSTAPVVVRVWRDMAPGSDFLRALFARPLPAGTRHYLLFTFRRNSAYFGVSGDGTVSVASQLVPEAQREATRVVGFDDTHDGVLVDPAVSALLNSLLAGAF